MSPGHPLWHSGTPLGAHIGCAVEGGAAMARLSAAKRRTWQGRPIACPQVKIVVSHNWAAGFIGSERPDPKEMLT